MSPIIISSNNTIGKRKIIKIMVQGKVIGTIEDLQSYGGFIQTPIISPIITK